MRTSTLRSQSCLLAGCTNLINPTPKSRFLIPFQPKSRISTSTSKPISSTNTSQLKPVTQKQLKDESPSPSPKGYLRLLAVGAASVGMVLIFMGMEEGKALALGPQGPLMEEFWDNVRRYALYALTVSTGALYTIFQPLVELLKNPISALLLVLLFGATFYIVSQVLSAMVGVTDFSYDYGY